MSGGVRTGDGAGWGRRASTIGGARLECAAMHVLAFDTSSAVTAVAVTDGDRVLAQDDRPGGRNPCTA